MLNQTVKEEWGCVGVREKDRMTWSVRSARANVNDMDNTTRIHIGKRWKAFR